jgi:hypothetical protein
MVPLAAGVAAAVMAGGVTTAVIVLSSTILMLDIGITSLPEGPPASDAMTWVAIQSPTAWEVKPDPLMMIGLSTPAIQTFGDMGVLGTAGELAVAGLPGVTGAKVIVGQLGWDGPGWVGGRGGSIVKS